MYGRGLDALFDALPTLRGLPPAALRRLLTGAWLDAVDHRDLGGQAARADELAQLRRLASALPFGSSSSPTCPPTRGVPARSSRRNVSGSPER